MSRLIRVPQHANENSALAGLEDVLGPGLGSRETRSFRLSPFHSGPMCSAPWLSMVFGMGISPPSFGNLHGRERAHSSPRAEAENARDKSSGTP